MSLMSLMTGFVVPVMRDVRDMRDGVGILDDGECLRVNEVFRAGDAASGVAGKFDGNEVVAVYEQFDSGVDLLYLCELGSRSGCLVQIATSDLERLLLTLGEQYDFSPDLGRIMLSFVGTH